MKAFVLLISDRYPKYHKRAGDKTFFMERILKGDKGHTVRGNYELWKKRIDQVQKGDAVLSLRKWSGKPYNSKQIEITEITKEDGVAVRKLRFDNTLNRPYMHPLVEGSENPVLTTDFIFRDGFQLIDDYISWFSDGKYDFTKPMALIHFNKFRY